MALVTNQRTHNQVCQLLTEAVTMLCKNMLPFSHNLCIEGLIGITTDSTSVILVNIKETITPSCVLTGGGEASYQMDVDSSPVNNRSKSSKLRRRRSNSSEADQSQISTEDKREATSEKREGRLTPVESAKEQSISVVEGRVKSIKQERDTVPCIGQDDHVYIGESCSSPLRFENNLPGKVVPTGWSEYNDKNAPMPSLTLPESTLLAHAGNSLEQIQSCEAYELIDQHEIPYLPHPNKISFAVGKDRSLLRHPRIAPNDYAKKHGSLSFSIERDPSGAELFICECGEPFRHRSSLYRHQMVHLGMAYRCDLCGIIMNRKDNLLTHKRRYCLAQKQVNRTGDCGNIQSMSSE